MFLKFTFIKLIRVLCKFTARLIGVGLFLGCTYEASSKSTAQVSPTSDGSAYDSCSEDSGTVNVGQCSTSASRYVYSALFGGRSVNCSSGGNGSACWTNAVNQYVSSVLGSAVSGADGSLTALVPAAYYDGSTSATMSDANLTVANIKSGVSIFGTTGNFTGNFNTVMSSGAHHDKATSVLSLDAETSTYAGTTGLSLPTTGGYTYREIPKISKDDDGYTGGSVIYVDRTGWGANTCGTAGALVARIADCAAHGTMGANATWDGAVKGNMGYGVWKLVTRTADLTSGRGREVWQDQRTGLLWSSLVSSSLNWCKASGSNFITNNPTAEDDPSNYCDNATYQTTGVWSLGVNKAISACYEDIDDDGASDYFTSTDAGIDSAGKASLGLSSTPKVAWRLPTINDYMQANINGIRFVVPDQAAEWSASVFSNTRSNAWFFVSAPSRLFESKSKLI